MKTRHKIILVGIVLITVIFGTYQSLMYQCGTMPVFMETPRNPTLWKCLDLWKHQSNQQILPSPPEPEPTSDSESLQQQEKLRVQEIVLRDTRETENKINAIKEYRDEFESGYFLEQFIHTFKENYEKDRLMHFVYGEWGFQPTENTSPKVTVYFRSYEDYNHIEKINEWQKPKDSAFLISPDSDGYLMMDLVGMPPAIGIHETCTIPGEYRVLASSPDDESKVEWGYFTCQRDKLVGEPQPWMELPA